MFTVPNQRFSIRHFEKDQIISVDTVNDAKTHVAARKELSGTYVGH
jgi:hypothetical protein